MLRLLAVTVVSATTLLLTACGTATTGEGGFGLPTLTRAEAERVLLSADEEARTAHGGGDPDSYLGSFGGFCGADGSGALVAVDVAAR